MLDFYSELKKELGLMDAAIEYLEFSVRYVEKNSTNLKEDIKSTGINLNDTEIKNIKQKPYSMYILSLYGVFDKFITEYRRVLEDVLHYQVKDYKLEMVLDCLSEENSEIISKLKSSLAYKGMEYYRSFRNTMAHPESDTSKKFQECTNLYFSATEWANPDFSKYTVTKEEIVFDDVNLFSKFIRDISDRLIDIIKDKKKILVHSLDFRKLNRYSNNKARFKQGVIQKIMTDLCLKKADALFLSNEIC